MEERIAVGVLHRIVESVSVRDFQFMLWLEKPDTPMNILDAYGVFMAFLEAKPCWQPQSEVWPES